LTVGADHHEIRGDLDEGKLSVHCYRRGELIGVETVNMAGDHMAARRLLSLPAPVTLEAVQASGHDLSALMKATAARG
jgi:3-phenylpropionate/trans-cinnamate dioxygenase ferredoxin reductase subunit